MGIRMTLLMCCLVMPYVQMCDLNCYGEREKENGGSECMVFQKDAKKPLD